LSNVVSSQEKIHAPYGGVVPEIASRHHLVSLMPVIRSALQPIGNIDNIDVIAVTNGPGLVGSLLVGIQGAKTLAWVWDKKLVAVNHLEAHLRAPFTGYRDNPPPVPPHIHLSLLVSGGHTILFHVEGDSREIIGATRDDAAGEAFDKVAKMLHLGYPGGRVIDSLASQGDPLRFRLPRGLHKRGGYDFSFSGLKTAVMQLIASLKDGVEGEIPHICASFQRSVVDSLVSKTAEALSNYPVEGVVLAGGVAANQELRRTMETLCLKRGIAFYVPPVPLCTDNAAMVASLGYELANRGEFASSDLNAFSSSLWSRRGELLRTKGR
ncbi:tRNA (adenosine(37)-N6)-threonylcarbamoyltransferase complex transferase subunit TsaD, partial [Myxococcota bacterium]|nr:tRNA (adenosine(37)-N6)-threonylcarbamoyltransferase complex transferase subunit TsaD [Myxococcota bacterium]